MATPKSEPAGQNVQYRVAPSDKEGYVKIEADIPAIAPKVENTKAQPPHPKTDVQDPSADAPPPEKTTATVAGYSVDDILKAPLQPPAPKPGDSGPQVAEKLNQAGYQMSKGIGPKKASPTNLILVGLGILICLTGLVAFIFLGGGPALTIIAIGAVATVLGIFIKF